MKKIVIPFKWVRISGNDYSNTSRCKVIGGWLVWRQDNQAEGHAGSMVFIPDPNHEWEIE